MKCVHATAATSRGHRYARRLQVTATSTSDRCPQHGLDRHQDIWSGVKTLAASISVAGFLLCNPVPSLAAVVPEPVYFGNGCFWGRQKDFIDTEKRIGRTSQQVTSVVGYAGGREVGPSGKVCYYYADPRTVYEKLGHAEVVSVQLDKEQGQAEQEFREFARTYFSEFKKTRIGMMRLDPQDAGPGYRNVVGLPGGVSSPYFKILQEANVNNMELREGQGNMYVQGQPVEGDEMNVVWVVDSNKLPFYMAEEYHQFHDGLGKYFPREYTQGLKSVAAERGLIHPTGCPEWPN